jgi:uncharacterized protein
LSPSCADGKTRVVCGGYSAATATRLPSASTAATTVRRLIDSWQPIHASQSFWPGVPAAKINWRPRASPRRTLISMSCGNVIVTYKGERAQARPRDRLGRPLPYGTEGVEPVPEEPLPPMTTISYAHELLAEGRPFSAHEVYEARWKAGPDSERELWQGLAQLCVGITHAERGNRIGALRLIGRARRRLETYSATGGPVYGLHLSQIIEWIQDRERQSDDGSWLADQPL